MAVSVDYLKEADKALEAEREAARRVKADQLQANAEQEQKQKQAAATLARMKRESDKRLKKAVESQIASGERAEALLAQLRDAVKAHEADRVESVGAVRERFHLDGVSSEDGESHINQVNKMDIRLRDWTRAQLATFGRVWLIGVPISEWRKYDSVVSMHKGLFEKMFAQRGWKWTIK